MLPEMPMAASRTTRIGVRQLSIDTTKPTIPVSNKRLSVTSRGLLREKEARLDPEPRSIPILHSRKIAALDEANEFVPFGMRQPDGIFVFPNRDSLSGDHDLGAFGAIRAKGEFDRAHHGSSLIQSSKILQSVVATEASLF